MAVFVAAAVPGAVRAVTLRARLARAFHADDVAAARRRCFGAYADGIAAIQKSLPPGADYLVAETIQNGAAYFVRSDLAPRRGWYLGVDDTVDALRAYGRPEGAPAWVVVTYGLGDAPRLMSAEAFYLGAPLPPR